MKTTFRIFTISFEFRFRFSRCYHINIQRTILKIHRYARGRNSPKAQRRVARRGETRSPLALPQPSITSYHSSNSSPRSQHCEGNNGKHPWGPPDRPRVHPTPSPHPSPALFLPSFFKLSHEKRKKWMSWTFFKTNIAPGPNVTIVARLVALIYRQERKFLLLSYSGRSANFFRHFANALPICHLQEAFPAS